MTSNLQLFLDRFVVVNKDRYKDDSDILPIFNTVTLADIVWDSIVVNQSDESKRIANFHSDTLMFSAKSQQWNCVALNNNAIINITDIKASIDAVKTLDTVGVYLYTDAGVTKIAAIVDKDSIVNNTAQAQTVLLLKGVLKYDFSDNAVSVKQTNADNVVFSVLAECFYGNVVAFETTKTSGGGDGGDGDGGDESTPEDEALEDPTGGGEFAGVGEAGFGMLTEPRTITSEVRLIPDILNASLGIAGAPAPVVEFLNENA